MPVPVGVRLGSAALQVLAEDAGVDVLHIKGPAALSFEQEDGWPEISEGWEATFTPRPSVDVDLLVRPSHVDQLFATLTAHGWELAYRFEDGSAFEHASTWLRRGLAAADVHRTFPGFGVDGEVAFERLWRERRQVLIAGYPCTIPSSAAQRLILILHAARGGDLGGDDLRRAWGCATAEQRSQVDALACDLGASAALAAGTGRLEEHRGSREYALWRALSTGERSLLRLWVARVQAQPTIAARLRTALVLVAPKPGRLRHLLGRDPRAHEVAAAWVTQLGDAVRAAARGARHRPRPRGGTDP